MAAVALTALPSPPGPPRRAAGLDLAALWEQVLATLQRDATISRASFSSWLAGTELLAFDGGRAIVGAQHSFARDKLDRSFRPAVAAALAACTGTPPVDVRFEAARAHSSAGAGDTQTRAAPSSPDALSQGRERANAAVEPAPPTRMPPIPSPLPSLGEPGTHAVGGGVRAPLGGPASPPALNPRYTFESFVVGRATQFAAAAARAVADNPAFAYNPLYLYGAPGTGKTHLLHAIGHRLLAARPQAAVTLVSARVLAAAGTEPFHPVGGTAPAALDAYRAADVLLVDDVQLLAAEPDGRARAAQTAFLHLFDELFEHGRQVVVTGDRPPRALVGLDDHVRSRLQMGLVADLGLPDPATRLAVLRARTEALHAAVPAATLELIAGRVDGSIRELEGALTRVVAAASLTNRPPTVEVAAAALASVAADSPRIRQTPEDVVRAVAGAFAVGLDALRSRRRDRAVVWPRHVAMYLLREVTGISLSDAGAHLGGRDHSTVLHGCERVESRLATDPAARDQVHALARQLRAGTMRAAAAAAAP